MGWEHIKYGGYVGDGWVRLGIVELLNKYASATASKPTKISKRSLSLHQWLKKEIPVDNDRDQH